MSPSSEYFGPTVVLLSAHVILGGIGVFLIAAAETPWPIRLLGGWVLIIAVWMGWFVARDLIDP